MSILVLKNEAVAARRRVYFHCVDATDGMTPETGEANGQPQISVDGAAFADAGVGLLVAIGNGRYYAELTQAVVNVDNAVIQTRYKSANTAEAIGSTVQVVKQWADILAATNAILADTGTDGVVVATASKTGYALSAPGNTAVVDEWETQSQADPTGFHVNVQEWLGVAVAKGATTGLPSVDLEAINDKGGASVNAGLAFDGTGFTFLNCVMPTVTTVTNGVAVAGITSPNLAKLEDILDGTGATGLTINSLVINGNAAGGVVNIDNAGGPAINATGSTHGVVFVGSGGHGLYSSSDGNGGYGIRSQGETTGHGIGAFGGTSGHGIYGYGGLVSGDGLRVEAQTDGDGIRATQAGSGVDLRGDITGNVTGNLIGSVGSLTGHTVQTGDNFARIGANGVNLSAIPWPDVYHADIWFTVDGANTRDEYTVQWYKNAVPVTSGITLPTIQVVKRADGTDLVAEAAMTQVGTIGAYKYDEGTNRQTAGEAVLMIVTATIDGATRTYRSPVSRDSTA